MADWSSAQYLKFRVQRTQPARDLAAMITADPREVREVIDIGCGPANSTAVLLERFPSAHVTGADNSADMLERARASCPKADFIGLDAGGDISAYNGRYDVVFSNACIQWIPDHAALIPRLFALLREGGTLAVQVPMNYDEPVHRIVRRLTESGRWARLRGVRTLHTLAQGEYFDILSALTEHFELKQITYLHRMPNAESILEWYRGTGLRPYLAALSPEEAAEFEREVLTQIRREYPPQKNGELIFRFPRLLFTAQKCGARVSAELEKPTGEQEEI